MVIFDPMSVAEPTRVLMIGIVVVRVLERGLGEREHKARNHAEMKKLPHEVPFYTRRSIVNRQRLRASRGFDAP